MDAFLETSREEIKRISKPRVGEQTAQTIANALTVKHMVEYIVHVKQQQEDEERQKSTNKNHTKNSQQTRLG